MNEILSAQEVIVFLVSEGLLFLLLSVASFVGVMVLFKWDFHAFTPEQFQLENRAYLMVTIVRFVLIVKMLLLPYFVYTLDQLSVFVSGAMCAAGVIKSNPYGNPLLMLKVVMILFSGLWLGVNHLDLQAKTYPYIRLKSALFLGMFLLMGVEIFLDFSFFWHIPTQEPVHCCSVIFGQLGGANSLPFGLDIPKLIILFYLLFVLILVSMWLEESWLMLFSGLLFSLVAYESVVYFFGTYIYQLPTHTCPFCMLQSHYYAVGYGVWGLLLLGLFFLLKAFVFRRFFHQSVQKEERYASLFLTLFVLLCSGYVVVYYVKNGVLL